MTEVAGKIGGEQPPEVFGGLELPTLQLPTADLKNTWILCNSPSAHTALSLRKKILDLTALHPRVPMVIQKDLAGLAGDELLLRASIDLGMALTDGFGDGIMITGGQDLDDKRSERLAFDILQATGRRITKTEYIACPSCGRTQFDIQKALQEVKEKTSHLVGLKIAVMGCVVNGPGEMADADYGYVGAGHGKVHIYKGQKPVKRNVPQEHAVDELLKIIDLPPGN
jgi:(E)-4-hydroxy-3-methylbut-2-enyl-diphosphate synthase